MKIIPANHKQSRLWVEACAASLDIDKAEAAAMYSNLCGFPSWNAIVQVIGTQKPTDLDETLSAPDLAARRLGYIEVLVSRFGLNRHYASHLIATLSPTSSKHPKKIAFDSASMREPDKDGREYLFPPGMESMMHDGMNAFMEMFKKTHPELGDFDADDLIEHSRMSKPINPGIFYDFCQNHDWDLNDESYKEVYVFGEPSFTVNSPKGQVLVYLNSITQTPYDDDDETANRVRNTVLENALSHNPNQRIILFWGQPLSKKIRDKSFTCVGSTYVSGKWHDMLMNRDMRSVDSIIDFACSGIDFNKPDEALSDKHNQTLQTFLALTVGAKNSFELSQIQFSVMGGASGWGVHIPMGKLKG